MKQSRNEIIKELFETMTMLKRGMEGHMHGRMHKSPLSRAQLELLFILRHTQPTSSKELASTLHLSPGAISQLVEGIEQHGFIERQPSEQDRRVQYLHISEKGEALIKQCEKDRKHMMEAVMQDLTDEELKVWLHVQQKMIEYFRINSTK